MTLDIPLQLYDVLPEHLKVQDIRREYSAQLQPAAYNKEDFAARVLEFSSAEKARDFFEQRNLPAVELAMRQEIFRCGVRLELSHRRRNRQTLY